METQFAQAIAQICDEKNIDKNVVMEAVEAALAAAYKKDYGDKDQEVRVHLSEEAGAMEVYISKIVVEEVDNEYLEISLSQAQRLDKKAKIGDTIEVIDLPADFGRIAAQTAKQVIVQRIREAERDMVFSEYSDKEGEIVNCNVQRIEGDTVICDLGKANGVLYKNEQIPGERYYPNQRFRVFIVKVEQTNRGPQIVISRSHPGMVKKLFESEVPEISTGVVEIKGVSREAGGRTKIAVHANDEAVDPVGSFVGQRGIRVQSVMNELSGEKIDIILWDEDPVVFVTNAISPAKISNIELDEKEEKATIKVPEDQLSLAIGKQGQNVRLAAKLTGWNIDIEGVDGSGVEGIEEAAQVPKQKKDKVDLEAAIIDAVSAQNTENGYTNKSVESKEKSETESKVKDLENEKSDSEEEKNDGKDDTKERVEEVESGPKEGEEPGGSDKEIEEDKK